MSGARCERRRVLVYGAGAIGRGFLPWVLPPDAYELLYVEADAELRRRLRERAGFTTHRVVPGGYDSLHVEVGRIFAPGEEWPVLETIDAVVTAVGPRHFFALESALAAVRAPVLCLENDASLPASMAERVGRHDIYFGIPDVIASRTAPPALRRSDPLAIVSESGVCFADRGVRVLGGAIRYVDAAELERQWLAKLYIHNTPHCIAAYLGAHIGVRYLHEAMAQKSVRSIVAAAMQEMTDTVMKRFGMDPAFCGWYRDKELARFEDPLLCDPIERVAREPFRKLGLSNRLIGAAQLALSCGIVPENLMTGIMAAFAYENARDDDGHIETLRSALEPQDFLEIIIRLRPREALFDMLVEGWEQQNQRLEGIRSV